MEPRVSFAIQSHPARADVAVALSRLTGAEIVFDPNPDAAVASPWRTYRHLLASTPDWATHRFQMQDDVTPCDGLADAVRAATAARPDRLLVFYVSANPWHQAQAVLGACARDESWAVLELGHWCPVVATCWPIRLIPQLFEYVDAQGWPEKYCSDDEIVGRFLREIDHRPLASVPSLVEHKDLIPSISGGRTRWGEDPGRSAVCWIGDCAGCASEIDWTTGPG